MTDVKCPLCGRPAESIWNGSDHASPAFACDRCLMTHDMFGKPEQMALVFAIDSEGCAFDVVTGQPIASVPSEVPEMVVEFVLCVFGEPDADGDLVDRAGAVKAAELAVRDRLISSFRVVERGDDPSRGRILATKTVSVEDADKILNTQLRSHR